MTVSQAMAMPGSPWMGTVFGLLAALTWGGGDFAGGIGSKAVGGSLPGTFRVVIAAHAISLAALLLIASLHGDHLPHTVVELHAMGWALAAGVASGFSISAFYLSLSAGEMGVAAAVSGLLSAAIPAMVGWMTEGRPTPVQVVGFVAAAVAIWLISVSGTAAGAVHRRTQWLALGSGAGFGAIFVCLRFANAIGPFEPLAFARTTSVLTTTALLLLLTRGRREPPMRLNRAAWTGVLGIAVLDTAGNLFYVAATRAGRLDVAAVLAALYPVSTILLAAVWLKERPTPRQWIGMGAAIAGVALMAA